MKLSSINPYAHLLFFRGLDTMLFKLYLFTTSMLCHHTCRGRTNAP